MGRLHHINKIGKWCFTCLNTIIRFLGMWLKLLWNNLDMRWLDVNVHFSVLTIVYLDVFLCLIVIALLSYFKGHMKILASVLYHKSHYSESYHQHSISNGISIAKMSFFSCKMFFFFGKNRKPISNAPQYYFFCLVIWYQYHFDTITHFSTISYPSIQRHPFLF